MQKNLRFQANLRDRTGASKIEVFLNILGPQSRRRTGRLRLGPSPGVSDGDHAGRLSPSAGGVDRDDSDRKDSSRIDSPEFDLVYGARTLLSDEPLVGVRRGSSGSVSDGSKLNTRGSLPGGGLDANLQLLSRRGCGQQKEQEAQY